MSLRIRFSSQRVQRLAEQATAGVLGPRGQRRLARRLEASAADREAYDLLTESFRALEGQPLLTTAQQERILDRALRAAGARTASPATVALRWLAPVAALLLVVAGAALLLPRDDAYQSRGSRVIQPRQAGHVGLKALCIRQGQVVAPPDRASGLDARCRLGDRLQLVVSHTAGFRQLLVVGLQEGGEQRWYYPLPPDGKSGPAPQGVDEEPLGQAIDLHVNHQPGPLRLVAVFSGATLRAARVFAWLKDLGPEQRVEHHSEELAMPGGNEVTAVELRVMIEGGAP